MTQPSDAEAKPAGVPSEGPPEGTKNTGSRIFNLVVFVVGGIALWWMLRTQDWSQFGDQIASIGWWAVVILALDLAALCCDAAALHAFMRPEARMIKYWRVLGAQASGRAINVLTPGGALGEATKLTMLVSNAPRSRVLSSIVLLNLSQVYLSTALMVIGTPITLLLVDLPHGAKVSVGIGMAIVVPAMVALAVVIHRGAVATVVGTLRRIRVISAERATSWKAKLVDVDRHIGELHKHRSAGTWKGILWILLSRAFSWAAVLLLLGTIGVPMTAKLILGVLSIGVLITWIANIVPLGLGVADGGNYVLYEVLGATGPQGLLIALINRARTVSVAILGLGAMAAMTVVDRIATARIQRKLRALRARAAATAAATEESSAAAAS